jgi:hypothetical protein
MKKRTNNTTVQIIVINSNTPEVTSEHSELFDADNETISEFVLTTLNNHGKGAHILMKRDNQFYLAYHTATGKTKSKTYHEEKVEYHPHMHQF